MRNRGDVVTVTDREGGWKVLKNSVSERTPPESDVVFLATGQSAKGEFHCAECGYGVTVFRELPRCPMCGCESWEQSAWSPFARARAVLQ